MRDRSYVPSSSFKRKDTILVEAYMHRWRSAPEQKPDEAGKAATQSPKGKAKATEAPRARRSDAWTNWVAEFELASMNWLFELEQDSGPRDMGGIEF